MPRKRINSAAILTNAEKQKRHRAKRKTEMEALKAAQISGTERTVTLPAPDITAIREQIKQELRISWEPEIKAAHKAAERKQGRELAKKADQNYIRGRTAGICNAAAFLAGKDRADIAAALLSHFMIDREIATAALEADRRTHSMTLASLDKSGAWGKPPDVIK